MGAAWAFLDRFPRLVPTAWAMIYTGAALAVGVVWANPASVWSVVRWLLMLFLWLNAILTWWDVMLMPDWRIREITTEGAECRYFEMDGKPLQGRPLAAALASLVALAALVHVAHLGL